MSLEIDTTSPTALAQRAEELAGEVGTYGPRSVPTELRREHLLTCATLLFTERGYDATSMSDVAAMALVTKPVVYDLFGSKEELFGAVMTAAHDELLSRVARAIEREQDPARLGFVATRAYFVFVRERKAAWQHLLRSGQGLVGEWVAMMQERHAAFLRDVVTANLEAAGLAFDARRVAALAEMLVGAVVSLAGWWVNQRDVSVDEIAAFYAAAMDQSVRAALGPPLGASGS